MGARVGATIRRICVTSRGWATHSHPNAHAPRDQRVARRVGAARRQRIFKRAGDRTRTGDVQLGKEDEEQGLRDVYANSPLKT